jgi:hypothetical protein
VCKNVCKPLGGKRFAPRQARCSRGRKILIRHVTQTADTMAVSGVGG